MITSTIDNLGPVRASLSQSAARPDLSNAQRSFLSVLGKRVDEPVADGPDEQARHIAEQLVSISFIQPMLKQLRATNNAAPPFAPTQAEKQFRALTDADLANQIVHAKQFPLVDRLSHDLLKRGGKLASGEPVPEELLNSPAFDRSKSTTALGAHLGY